MPAAPGQRNAPVAVTIALVLLGVACVVVGIVYFAETATRLPSFFPGHQAGDTKHHTKHGIAAVVVGLIAFAGAWMSAGRKRTSA